MINKEIAGKPHIHRASDLEIYAIVNTPVELNEIRNSERTSITVLFGKR